MTINKLIKMINESNYIVFFGGAGVSTGSGLKDFRGEDGLYKNKFMNRTPEYLLSIDCLINEPELFYDYYKTYFLNTKVKPNNAHSIIAKLEEMGKVKAVITQNIDDLHQQAGSKNVYELHGSVHRNYSIDGKNKYTGTDIITNSPGIPFTKDNVLIRPDVTLYGEPLNEEIVSGAINEISKADMIIVAGTSLTVYPAASFIHHFKGKYLVGINLEELNLPFFIKGKVEEVLSQIDLNKIK